MIQLLQSSTHKRSAEPQPVVMRARAIRWSTIASLLAASACTSLTGGAASVNSFHLSSLQASQLTLASSGAALPSASDDHMYAPNIAIGDSLLRATIVRMRGMSPSFDSAMRSIEQSGIPVIIGTAEQLRDELPPGYAQVSGWQAVTAIYPLTRLGAPGKPIDHFSVIVRLKDLRAALADGKSATDSSLFNRYVERVVAHEIYGHLIPQLQLGKTAPIACDDPTSGDDWYSACVMQRERHVMAQLVKARGIYSVVAQQ